MHFGRWSLRVVVAGVGLLVIAMIPPTAALATPELRVADAQARELVTMVKGEPATFGGVSYHLESGTLTIRVTRPQGRATALSRVATLAAKATGVGKARWRVEVISVDHSLAELNAVKEKVGSDRNWRSQADSVISEWYVDVESNAVAVGVTRRSPQVEAAARALFGDAVRFHVAERATRHSRTADWEPWAGGIRLRVGRGSCSSGFPIRKVTTGARMLVTAGHCFAVGATVTNDGVSVGKVLTRINAENGLDVEYIYGGQYAAWTYKGPPASGYGDAIRGGILTEDIGFEPVCINGATTGEVCTGIVTATDVCVYFDDGMTNCHLNKLRNTNGGLSTAGDSGGNLFRVDSGGLKIVGMIIGGYTDRTVTWYHPYDVLLPSGWVLDTV